MSDLQIKKLGAWASPLKLKMAAPPPPPPHPRQHQEQGRPRAVLRPKVKDPYFQEGKIDWENTEESDYPIFLEDVDFCLTWAIDINLTPRKAETIIKSFNIIQTTRDRLSRISHHILKSFFFWFLNKKCPSYYEDAKKEIGIAASLLSDWEKEAKKNMHCFTYNGFIEDYIDGIDYGKF